jgi:uncharacterized membrane protein
MNLVDFSIALLVFASIFVMKCAYFQKEVYFNQVMPFDRCLHREMPAH